MNISFTSNELGDISSFNNSDPPNNGDPLVIYIRPRPICRTTMSCKEIFPDQTGTNKEGKIVPLKDFDIFDMLNGFMSSKDLNLLMEKEKIKK